MTLDADRTPPQSTDAGPDAGVPAADDGLPDDRDAAPPTGADLGPAVTPPLAGWVLGAPNTPDLRRAPSIRVAYSLALEVYSGRLLPLLVITGASAAISALAITFATPVVAMVALLAAILIWPSTIAVAGGWLHRPEIAIGAAPGLALRRSLHVLATAILIGLAALPGSFVAAILIVAVLGTAGVAGASPAFDVGYVAGGVGVCLAIGMLLLIVPVRLILALPAVILDRQGVTASLGQAWDGTRDRKRLVLATLVAPYTASVVLGYGVGLFRLVSPEVGIVVLVLTSTVLGSFTVAMMVALAHLLVPRTALARPEWLPLVAAPDADLSPPDGSPRAGGEPSRSTVSSPTRRRFASLLLVAAVVVGLGSSALGTSWLVNQVGSISRTTFGRTIGSSPCEVGRASTDFASGEAIYWAASLSRVVRVGESLEARMERDGAVLFDNTVPVTAAGRCLGESTPFHDLSAARYRLAFSVNGVVLADGVFDIR